MPDETNPEKHARYETFTEVYMHRGWSRHLPIGAIELLPHFAEHGRMTLGALHAHMLGGRASGLQGAPWDEPKTWTEKDREWLAEDREDGEQVKSVEELNADEEQDHAETVARFAAYADALGVPHCHTMFDVLTFAIACRVITAEVVDGETWLDLNPAAPLPAEVLPLPEEEQRSEDEIRWQRINEPVMQGIIALFRPGAEDRPDVKKTSLERLARDLEVSVDTARTGLASLLKQPDFSANKDVETLRDHEVFEIRVDWEVFEDTRMFIRFGRPGEDEDPEG